MAKRSQRHEWRCRVNRKRFSTHLPQVDITEDMSVAIRKAANKYGEPISAIVRLAIREFLAKEAQERE